MSHSKPYQAEMHMLLFGQGIMPCLMDFFLHPPKAIFKKS